VLGIAAGYLMFLSLGYIRSSSEAYTAKNLIRVSQSYEEIKAPLVKALNNRPNHPEAAVYLSLLDQKVFDQVQNEQFLSESYAVVTRALQDEPYNKDLLSQLVNYYDLKGQNEEAYHVYLDNADKFMWDISWYDQLISRAAILGLQANAQQDEAQRQEYFTVALDAYKHVTDGIEYLKTLPPKQLQGREFYITAAIALNAGKVQLMSGQAEAAQATLGQSSLTDMRI
jgi:tetratricopeptide (TPR) repeat protein